jgi:hypothetical protein
MSAPPALSLHRVYKRFLCVHSLYEVSIELVQGEVFGVFF